MPHCIIEYSNKSLDANLLMETAFNNMVKSGLFDAKGIKVRAKQCDMYKLSEHYSDFLHINIRILEGRTVKQRSSLIEVIIDGIKPLINLDSTSLTLELTEMAKDCYYK